MKIVQVAPVTPLSKGGGGLPRSAGAYIQLLLRLGSQVTLVASDASQGSAVTPAALAEAYPGVKAVLYAPSISRRWAIGPGFLNCIPALRAADIVCIHGAMNFASIAAAWLCRLLRTPYVIVAHGQLDLSRWKSIRKRRPLAYRVAAVMVQHAARHANSIILSGQAEEQQLVAWAPKGAVAHVANFFRFERFLSAPEPPPSLKTYVFVGRIEEDKGIRRFIEIWMSAASADSRLTLIGSGAGAYLDSVLDLISGDPRIEFLGEQPSARVMSEMHKAAAVVLPTGLDRPVTENFGNVIVEGLLQGRPALVTKGLHWDAFADTGVFYLFDRDADSVADLIRAFETLSPDEYAEISLAAYILADQFHEDQASTKLGPLLTRVAGRKRAGSTVN